MVVLMQKDVDAAVEFYKKFELPLKFHIEGKWAEFVSGDVKIGLCATEHDKWENRTGIVLEVEDLRADYDHLLKQGVEFLSEPVEAKHGIMVSFKDLQGNILDLYQPTHEKIKDIIKEASKKCVEDDEGKCSDESCSEKCCDEKSEDNCNDCCSENGDDSDA